MSERGSDVRPSAEYTGKTVEEALKRAAAALRVDPETLEYEVLKDRGRTVFGLVRTGEATIRVWLPRVVGPYDAETAAEDANDLPEADALSDGGYDADESSDEEAVTEEGEEVADAEVEESPLKPEPIAPAPSSSPVATPNLEKAALRILSTLLDKMEVLAAVEVVDRGGEEDEESGETTPLVLNIVGDDLGGLIGRRGETLRDLQFMVRLMVSREVGDWPNIVLDVEGYKAKRVTGLQSLAHRMADQVRSSGQSVVLEPMPAHERRIIHLALRDDPDVYTESTGEDEGRKVQILHR